MLKVKMYIPKRLKIHSEQVRQSLWYYKLFCDYKWSFCYLVGLGDQAHDSVLLIEQGMIWARHFFESTFHVFVLSSFRSF